MENGTNQCRDPWNGVPEELRLMCFSQELSSDTHYCTQPILQYLIDHLESCGTSPLRAGPPEVLHWVDIAIETSLFPLELYEDEWISYSDQIGQILSRSEKLLQDHIHNGQDEGSWMMYDFSAGSNETLITQKFDVYSCVHYMFTDNWNALKTRLKKLLAGTKDNVRHLLLCDEADRYAAQAGRAEIHYPGMDIWEPLNWLARESVPEGTAQKLLLETYESYTLFLEKLSHENQQSTAAHLLHQLAEKRLADLCDLVLDEIEYSLKTAVQSVRSLAAEKKRFETISQNNWKRATDDQAEEKKHHDPVLHDEDSEENPPNNNSSEKPITQHTAISDIQQTSADEALPREYHTEQDNETSVDAACPNWLTLWQKKYWDFQGPF